MQVGVEKTFWSMLGFDLLVMLNYVANGSWCVMAESWLEGCKWSTISLIYLSRWLLFLLMGRKARIYNLVWISKDGWRDLRIMSYLGRVALQPSWKCHGGGDGCRAWEEGKDERVDCAQHLGRRWIKVCFSAKCEGCSRDRDSWSREEEDCRALDKGATLAWVCGAVEQ